MWRKFVYLGDWSASRINVGRARGTSKVLTAAKNCYFYKSASSHAL